MESLIVIAAFIVILAVSYFIIHLMWELGHYIRLTESIYRILQNKRVSVLLDELETNGELEEEIGALKIASLKGRESIKKSEA